MAEFVRLDDGSNVNVRFVARIYRDGAGDPVAELINPLNKHRSEPVKLHKVQLRKDFDIFY